MTQGNILAEKLKVNDVLYFENRVSRSFIIITNIQNKIINYITTEFDLRSNEIAVYENNVNYYNWNRKDLLGQQYEYCENPRTAIAIIDLFSYKVKFL